MDPEKTPDKSGGRQVLVVVGVLGAIAVNIAAFMLSADAINAVAVAAGISKKIAWAMVAAVDGLMVTGTVVFIANKLRGRSVAYPLCVLGSGVLLSIICNALHAKAGGGHVIKLSSHSKMAVSAIPAVSLALSFHLIADMVKDSLGVTKEASGAASEERLPERLMGVRPDASDASAETSADASAGRAPERLPDASQTPAEASTQTHPQTPAKVAKKTPKKKTTPKPSTRQQVRQILIETPEMSAADVARKLGRAPSGHMRTMCAELLSELIESGTIDAPPLRIAQ